MMKKKKRGCCLLYFCFCIRRRGKNDPPKLSPEKDENCSNLKLLSEECIKPVKAIKRTPENSAAHSRKDESENSDTDLAHSSKDESENSDTDLAHSSKDESENSDTDLAHSSQDESENSDTDPTSSSPESASSSSTFVTVDEVDDIGSSSSASISTVEEPKRAVSASEREKDVSSSTRNSPSSECSEQSTTQLTSSKILENNSNSTLPAKTILKKPQASYSKTILKPLRFSSQDSNETSEFTSSSELSFETYSFDFHTAKELSMDSGPVWQDSKSSAKTLAHSIKSSYDNLNLSDQKNLSDASIAFKSGIPSLKQSISSFSGYSFDVFRQEVFQSSSSEDSLNFTSKSIEVGFNNFSEKPAGLEGKINKPYKHTDPLTFEKDGDEPEKVKEPKSTKKKPLSYQELVPRYIFSKCLRPANTNMQTAPVSVQSINIASKEKQVEIIKPAVVLEVQRKDNITVTIYDKTPDNTPPAESSLKTSTSITSDNSIISLFYKSGGERVKNDYLSSTNLEDYFQENIKTGNGEMSKELILAEENSYPNTKVSEAPDFNEKQPEEKSLTNKTKPSASTKTRTNQPVYSIIKNKAVKIEIQKLLFYESFVTDNSPKIREELSINNVKPATVMHYKSSATTIHQVSSDQLATPGRSVSGYNNNLFEASFSRYKQATSSVTQISTRIKKPVSSVVNDNARIFNGFEDDLFVTVVFGNTTIVLPCKLAYNILKGIWTFFQRSSSTLLAPESKRTSDVICRALALYEHNLVLNQPFSSTSIRKTSNEPSKAFKTTFKQFSQSLQDRQELRFLAMPSPEQVLISQWRNKETKTKLNQHRPPTAEFKANSKFLSYFKVSSKTLEIKAAKATKSRTLVLHNHIFPQHNQAFQKTDEHHSLRKNNQKDKAQQFSTSISVLNTNSTSKLLQSKINRKFSKNVGIQHVTITENERNDETINRARENNPKNLNAIKTPFYLKAEQKPNVEKAIFPSNKKLGRPNKRKNEENRQTVAHAKKKNSTSQLLGNTNNSDKNKFKSALSETDFLNHTQNESVAATLMKMKKIDSTEKVLINSVQGEALTKQDKRPKAFELQTYTQVENHSISFANKKRSELSETSQNFDAKSLPLFKKKSYQDLQKLNLFKRHHRKKDKFSQFSKESIFQKSKKSSRLKAGKRTSIKLTRQKTTISRSFIQQKCCSVASKSRHQNSYNLNYSHSVTETEKTFCSSLIWYQNIIKTTKDFESAVYSSYQKTFGLVQDSGTLEATSEKSKDDFESLEYLSCISEEYKSLSDSDGENNFSQIFSEKAAPLTLQKRIKDFSRDKVFIEAKRKKVKFQQSNNYMDLTVVNNDSKFNSNSPRFQKRTSILKNKTKTFQANERSCFSVGQNPLRPSKSEDDLSTCSFFSTKTLPSSSCSDVSIKRDTQEFCEGIDRSFTKLGCYNLPENFMIHYDNSEQ